MALETPQLQTAQLSSVKNMQFLSWTKLVLEVTKK